MPNTEPAVIDSHLHLWDPAQLEYGWLSGTELQRAFLPADLDTGQHAIAGFIVVQADCLPGQAEAEVAFVRGLARRYPGLIGMVAHARLEAGEGARPQVRALAANPFVAGVRRLLQDAPGLAAAGSFITGVRLLAEHGLPFDACVRHQQLGEVAALAGACPDVTVVLDHAGKPSRDAGATRGWAAQLAQVAAEPNTVCKLSGLMTEPGFTRNDAKPVIGVLRTAIDTFGPQRCMFGSDWPLLTAAVTYQWWADTVLEAVSDLPPADQRALMGGTAAGTYRISKAPALAAAVAE